MIDGGLGKLWQKHLPEIHWTRIETGGTGRGIPDLNFCCQGIEGWIENKGTKTPILPEQVGFIERRRRADGRIFLAKRYQAPAGVRRGPARDEVYLYSGDDIRLLVTPLRARERDVAPIVMGSGGPANWPWDSLREALLYFSFATK